MNFKTTLLLAIVLLVVGITYFISSREQNAPPPKADDSSKLVGIASTDMQKITITPADGKPVVLERSGGDWKITAPVSAMAEKFVVDDLLTSLSGLSSKGEAAANDADRAALGLDKPTKVQVVGKDGKTVELAFGGRSSVGNVTYVLVGDAKAAKLVPADILEKLDDPARKYRDMRLVTAQAIDVKQVVITRPDGQLKFQKSGENWTMTAPTQMPVETFEITDVITTSSGLRASEVVSEDAKDAARYGLSPAKYSVELSAGSTAATNPATLPAPVTIRVGSYSDIRKEDVYASAGTGGPVAKVRAGIARLLTKKPLEFRNKQVLEINPAEVKSIALLTDLPATTQPTTREASKTAVSVLRNEAADLQGPPVPATTQSTTAATTREAPAPWVFADSKKPADEQKVKDLLDAVKTVRATRYLESMPQSQVKPNAIYTLTIQTVAAGGASTTHELRITDRGNTGSPVGQYNGLIFELDREFLAKLKL